MLETNVKSFLNSDFVKNLEGKKVIVISDIENLTDDDIDIELLGRKFARQIRNSKKFVLTNAIAGSGSKKDKMIKDSRNLRNDEEYNQYTTKEKGNLLAPDYSLAGKITQRTKNIGKNVRVDYQFLIVLSDIKTGIVLWDNEEIISKVIARDKLGEFDGAESKQDSSNLKKAKKEKKPKKEKTYSYAGEKAKEFFRNAWYKTKEFFSFGPNGRNHILVGIDFGIGGGSVGFAPFDFNIIESMGSSWRDEIKQHKISYEAINFVSPINMKVGYMRNIGDNWAFAINAIYNRTFALIDDANDSLSDSWKTTASFYSDLDDDNSKLSHRIERFGGELLLYYKISDYQHDANFADFYVYGGGGVLKDLNSNYTLTLEADRSSYYDISINTKGQKTLTFQQKIDDWYPLIRLGIFWNLVYGGVDTGFYCSWSTKEGNYLGTNCGVSVGLQARY